MTNSQNIPLLEHLRQEARSAHNNISHRPDQRGDMVIKDYSRELADDLAQIKTWPTEETADRLDELVARYHADYVSKLRKWIGATSRCASSFITGPANFPVERMQKRNRSADNRYTEWRQWREKALKGIKRSLQPKQPVDELTEARIKLEVRQKDQQLIKDGNAVIRAAKGNLEKAREELLKLGISERNIQTALYPSWGKPGFPAWMLANNNKEIHRLRDRVTVLEAKQAEAVAVGGERRVPFEGGEVILNYELDRVQIAHDVKPEQAVINKLKQGAFKWSPTNQAWQRKITPFAIAEAQKITGAILIEPKPARTLPLPDAVRQAVGVLPRAWLNIPQPYPAEVEAAVVAALASGEGLLHAAEELQAALPDAALAGQVGIEQHVIDTLTHAIRAAREALAVATLPEQANVNDDKDDD